MTSSIETVIPQKTQTQRALLWAEFAFISIVIPGIIIGFKLAPYMFLALWGTQLLTFLIFRKSNPGITRQDVWKWEMVKWSAMNPCCYVGCSPVLG